MSTATSAARVTARARSYPVFMGPALSSPFFRKRALYLLSVPVLVLAVCLHFAQAVLGFFLMAVACWPFPFRCRIEEDGICISWLLVSECSRWDELRAVRFEEDRRWGVIGRRRKVLLIERSSGTFMTLRGKGAVLRELASRIAEHVERKQVT